MSRIDVDLFVDDNGTLIGVYTKNKPGVIRVITFMFVEGQPMILQKGTFVGQQPFKFTLLEGTTSEELITVISYGTLGRNPVIEFGPEFDGSDKIFAVWNAKKIMRRV